MPISRQDKKELDLEGREGGALLEKMGGQFVH